jgi:hypothetical protein
LLEEGWGNLRISSKSVGEDEPPELLVPPLEPPPQADRRMANVVTRVRNTLFIGIVSSGVGLKRL